MRRPIASPADAAGPAVAGYLFPRWCPTSEARHRLPRALMPRRRRRVGKWCLTLEVRHRELPFAHAWRGLGGLMFAYPFLDAAAHVRIDVLPVLEGSLQHGRTHAAKQAAGHCFNQACALRVVEHLAHQNARLRSEEHTSELQSRENLV